MIYYLTALLNGFFNSINRMTNVRAGKLFGTANGALINYVEATVLSLLLVFVLKNGKELTWGYITAVPWWVYLGSVCGLLAQLLQIIGTLHSNTLVSSVLMLVGNLGMSLTLDYVFYGTFSLLRAAGILGRHVPRTTLRHLGRLHADIVLIAATTRTARATGRH